MHALKIENVPLPPSGKRAGLSRIMKKLRVGESFKLPKGLRQNLAHAHANHLGIKVTVKKEGESHRVWRIK